MLNSIQFIIDILYLVNVFDILKLFYCENILCIVLDEDYKEYNQLFVSNLYCVSVRNCRTQTTPRVEKKDLLEAQTDGLTLGFRGSSSAGMDRGLYRRSHTVREGGCSSQRAAGLLASFYL
jgi:hypothetical protein